MRRFFVAAILVAAAGVVMFDAPVRASTSHAAVMADNTNPTQLYKFAKGVCGTVSGDGNFSIQAGDEITWKNCTQAPHTVTADDGSFDSGNVAAGASYARTFTSAGQIAYHCEIHTYMTGTITVAEAPTPTTQQTTPTTQAATTTTTTTKQTTTTVPASTTTTADINGVFDGATDSTGPTTTFFTTDTTRALGEGGGGGTSAGVVAALVLGLGAVGTAGALLIRRIRTGAPPS